VSQAVKEKIHRILNAGSLAVVGASSQQDKWGYQVLKNILASRYGGRVYAVNPKEDEILGVPAYPTLSAIPGDVDLLVMTIPAAAIPAVLAEGAAKGVQGAAILSAGFRETGNTALEARIQEISRQSGLRLIGPNIQGIYLPHSRICAAPFPFLMRPGSIAVISQSGSVTATLGEWGDLEGVGMSALINLGNQADLCEADFLEYFADDPNTGVIALYLEGPKEGRRFAAVLAAAARRKPVVVLKPGRTAGGQRAAASHTASIAGDDAVFSVACRQYGAIRAEEMESFYDTVKTLGMLPLPRGNRIGVATTSGGTISLFIDEAEARGLAFASLPEEAAAALKACPALSSGGINIGSYLDIPGIKASNWQAAAEILAGYDYADMHLFIIADPVAGVEHVIAGHAAKAGVPVAVAYMGGGEAEKVGRLALQAAGIPVYPTPERAAKGLAALAWYAQYRREHSDGRQ
jgi:acyl-CoA synthetase (NDP forming)